MILPNERHAALLARLTDPVARAVVNLHKPDGTSTHGDAVCDGCVDWSRWPCETWCIADDVAPL